MAHRPVRPAPAAALLALTLIAAAAPAAADPAPAVRPPAGDVQVHDPALVAGGPGEDWYVFGTGDAAVSDGNIQIRTAADGSHWDYDGAVWDTKPAWLAEEGP